MTEQKTAEFIKDVSGDFRGTAHLYKLSEPVSWSDYDDEGKEVSHETDFVIVSATIAMFSGPETYIFPATEDGEIAGWRELEGSYRGGMNHKAALRNAGYMEAA